MKATFTILSLMFIYFSATAGTAADSKTVRTPAEKLAYVKELAALQLGQDIKTEVSLTEEGICGSEGPSYIVDVKVKHNEKSLDEKTGEIKFTPVWETVKTYGVRSDEIDGPVTVGLMDSEDCME